MSQEDTQDGRFPPRFWWGNRIVLAGAVAIVGVLGVRLLVGWQAAARADTLLAGFRTDPAEAPLADRDNAAFHLVTVVGRIVPQGELPFGLQDALEFDELRRDHAPLVRTLLERNAPVLDGFAEVRRLPRADWFVAGAPGTFGYFGDQRQLAKLLALDGRMALPAGNQHRAAERITDLLTLSDRLAQGPEMLSVLVASAIDQITGMIVEPWLAADLPPVDAQTRALLTGLIDDLLQQDALRATCERALLNTVVRDAGNIRDAFRAAAGFPNASTIPSTSAQQSAELWPVRPILDAEAVRLLAAGEALAARLREDPFEEQASSCAVPPTGLERVARPFSVPTLQSYDRMIVLLHRDLAYRRCLAAALACILYRSDHGRLPASLRDLVPDYLPAVPTDPFGDGDQELIYDRSDGYLRIRPRTERVEITTAPPDDPQPLPPRVRAALRQYQGSGAPPP